MKNKKHKTYSGKATRRIVTKRKWLALSIAFTIGLSVIGIADTLTAKSIEPSIYLTIEHKVKPVVEEFKAINVSKGVIREVSAYTSDPAETDDSPCISADNTDICERYKKGECIAASNAFPLRSKIYIDKIGECTVADRMAKRFDNRVDLYMGMDKQRAFSFGVQNLLVAAR